MVKEGDEIIDHYIAFNGQIYQLYNFGPNTVVTAEQLERKANELALSANELERPADWDANPKYKYGLIEEVPTNYDVPGLETPALTFYEKAMVPLRLMRELLVQIQIFERWWNENCGNGLVECATGNENELGFYIPDVIAAVGNILIDEGKDIPEIVIMIASLIFDAEYRDEMITAVSSITIENLQQMFTQTGKQMADYPYYYVTYEFGALAFGILVTGGVALADNVTDMLKRAKKLSDIVLVISKHYFLMQKN